MTSQQLCQATSGGREWRVAKSQTLLGSTRWR